MKAMKEGNTVAFQKKKKKKLISFYEILKMQLQCYISIYVILNIFMIQEGTIELTLSCSIFEIEQVYAQFT